mmetsp:Transcript_143637/g.459580  ORF Transcript_143637/g.459580 Transcript_143637/m.459580 type:complete len:204 (+) Transcript_143637:46-657(+)
MASEEPIVAAFAPASASAPSGLRPAAKLLQRGMHVVLRDMEATQKVFWLGQGCKELLASKLVSRQERFRSRSADLRGLQARPVDSLIIVAGDEESDLASEALEVGLSHLAPGGRLVVFGQHLQPLAARQGVFRTSGAFVDVKLNQLFTREYQVLPQRTHPIMTAEAMLCEGFLLTATKVTNEERASGGDAAVDEAPRKKRQRS